MRSILLLMLVMVPFLSGCPIFDGSETGSTNSSGTGDGVEANPAGDVTHQERDVSGKIALALGGVAQGMDELVFDEGLQILDFTNEDGELFSVEPRDEFDGFLAGKGARLFPWGVGVGYVTPIVNARRREPVQVTVPPQKLIQILIGEARGELDREATLDDETGEVKGSSVSVTGDCLSAVIRNRIELINDTANPRLFLADPVRYEIDAPLSYYEAVIEADNGLNFQFLPVDSDDPSHDFYLAAELREAVGRLQLTAYDQAVLTAAALFNGDTKDPTGGAFAFYSPTPGESIVLFEALETGDLELPSSAGTSDLSFPALAPIQVLIHPEVAPSSVHAGVPSFVFVRERIPLDPAVTDEP